MCRRWEASAHQRLHSWDSEMPSCQKSFLHMFHPKSIQPYNLRVGVGVSISRFHRDDSGSNPERGKNLLFFPFPLLPIHVSHPKKPPALARWSKCCF